MTDLHGRLTAAVRLRRQQAEAATKGPWPEPLLDEEPGPDAGWWVFGGGPGTEEHAVCVAVPYNPHAEVDARFIAANDPATVLRRCERDEKVLERHAPRVGREGPHEGEPICGCSNGQDEWYATAYPCDEIRWLAEELGVDLGITEGAEE